jgi:hypothetical protein
MPIHSSSAARAVLAIAALGCVQLPSMGTAVVQPVDRRTPRVSIAPLSSAMPTLQTPLVGHDAAGFDVRSQTQFPPPPPGISSNHTASLPSPLNPRLPSPPPPCPNAYDNHSGIYWSTYGGVVSNSVVPLSALGLIDDVLSFNHIRGVAHYQNWSTLEIEAGVYNWTLLDALFDSAARANKSVILGLQAGVCAPRWLLEQDGVALVKFVHHNPGWFGWASWQSYIDGIPVITYARQWENPLYTAALERVVRALGARWRRPHAASAPPFHRSGTRSFPTRLCLNS